MPDGGRSERERLERDFLAEAEEVFDALADALRSLEEGLGSGPPRRPLVNSIFREVHSLKGLAGLQGHQGIADLAHALEDLLDRLRLGRADLSAAVLELIHETFDALQSEVRALGGPRSAARVPGMLEERLRAAAAGVGVPDGRDESPGPLGIDPRVVAALSEYEERRLAEITRNGGVVLLVRLRLGPRDFDVRLREIVGRIESRGEVICTVPVLEKGDETDLHFALLVTSERGAEGLVQLLQGAPATVQPLAVTGAGPAGAKVLPPEEGREEARGVSDSLRVPVARLDEVLAQVADLSIALAAVGRSARSLCQTHPVDREARELDRLVRELVPRVRALQRSTIDARLVPVERIFGRIGRMVARAARSAGKEVEFHTLGGETELDKSMTDELASPLVQLLRNALDHGIEPPDEREKAGKPRRGRLVLSAFQKGRSAIIDVSDDGRGISIERVRAAAQAAGLIPAGAALSEAETRDLIFSPGFSTAARVSQESGRGVGLDVVRRSIRRLKGTIVVRSLQGIGTTFTIALPTTLVLVQALIVRACGQRFAIPIGAVRESLRLESARLRRSGSEEVYDHPRGPLPLVRLASLMRPDQETSLAESKYAVVAGPHDRPVGIIVDGFLGQQEVVIKPIGQRLTDLPGLAGATDLGDATAVLVLDPEGLIAGGSRERPLL